MSLNCSRCNAEAVVKRGSAAYCAKCALARDWEDVIAIVQEDRVDIDAVEVVEMVPPPTAKAAEPAAEGKEPAAAAVAADSNGGRSSEGLPADPFA